jgi:hypothetical protein
LGIEDFRNDKSNQFEMSRQKEVCKSNWLVWRSGIGEGSAIELDFKVCNEIGNSQQDKKSCREQRMQNLREILMTHLFCY